jgi:subtilisin family serine protease
MVAHRTTLRISRTTNQHCRSQSKRLRRILGLTIVLAIAPSFALAQIDPKVFEKVTRPQIEALMAMKAARTPAQQKIDSTLLHHLERDRLPRPSGGVIPHLAFPAPDLNKQVDVNIAATITPELLAAIAQQGGKVVSTAPDTGVVHALVPLNMLESLAGRPDVRAIRTLPEMFTHQAASFEGDVAHAANQARSLFQATGTGIKVCVISNNVQYLSTTNMNVSFLLDQNGNPKKGIAPNAQPGPGDGEGTAMLAIVNKLAPDATLMFAPGSDPVTRADQMKANIADLVTAGCKIIVDDITNRNEAPFQNSDISKAVNQAASAGVLYFSSAGNYGNLKSGTSQVWEGDYVAGGAVIDGAGNAVGNYHQFQAGLTASQINKIYDPIPNSTTSGLACPLILVPNSNPPTYSVSGTAALFWNDPLGGSSNDYDLYVVGTSGNVFSYSNNNQQGTSDPYEVASLMQDTSIVVVKKTAANARHLRVDIMPSCARLQYATEGSTRGHNAVAGAVTVAAVSAQGRTSRFSGGPDVNVAIYSSDGPRRVYFDDNGNPFTPNDYTASGGQLIFKPDLSAASDVMTNVTGFQPFYGTSAAAPHAAAIAALIWSAQPNYTAAQVLQAMRASALRIEGTRTGPTIRSGDGIVIADTSVNDSDPARLAAATFAASVSNGQIVTTPNMSVTADQYVRIYPDYFWILVGGITAQFTLAQSPQQDLRLFVTAVAAGEYPQAGSVPVSIAVNGTSLTNRYDIVGDGGAWNYVTSQFVIPQSSLNQGSNTIRLSLLEEATSIYRLQSLRVQP